MNESRPKLVRLEWDSQHFQFPVARIEGDTVAREDLVSLLNQARREQVRLVYWNGPLGTSLPQALLSEYDGMLVDRKVTLTRPLTDDSFPRQQERLIRIWPQGAAPESLVRLAMASGEHSRFRVDTRFPTALFELLYEQWIQRSTSGEIADAVLVASDPASEEPLGLITVAVKAGVGHIGLFAVDAQSRGCGRGTALLTAAHEFMLSRSCHQSCVTTQGDNEAALRLYRRAGYCPSVQSTVYHFWPLTQSKEGRDEY